MTLQQQLANYVPYNDQEIRDLELFRYAVEHFPDVLTRNNLVCHFTASNWIVNKDRSKVLLIYHNIYNHWAWTGGHADGDADLRDVALREAKEETGLTTLIPIVDSIYSVQCLCVDRHIHHGEFVSSHLHLDCCYLWQADESEQVHEKSDENSGVAWIPIEQAVKIADEPTMDAIYSKLNQKLKNV